MIRVIFQGTYPKEVNEEIANEDAFAISPDHKKLVLCDGASESYNSKLWSKIICESFIENDELNEDWLKSTIKKYVVEHDFESMSWSQLSAYQRGSFSTLTSITLNSKTNEITVRLFGDSFIFFFGRKNGLYEYIPTFEIPDFDSSPLLLSTKMDLNSEIDLSPSNINHCFNLSLENSYESIVAICATDALADWFSRAIINIENNRLLHIFLTMNNKKFKRLVDFCRKRGSLKFDDTTLIIAEIK